MLLLEIMLSREDSRKKACGTSRNGKFLNDIETISKTFYMDKTLPRLASSTASSRSKSVGKIPVPEPKQRKPDDAKSSNKVPEKDKKSSIWSWKGLKSLTHVRNRKFNCCFSLQVHSIENLPAYFNDTCLLVHWKRRDCEQTTRPIRVSRGVAEFEEQLTHSCSVYGSMNGPHHSAKYEAKHFLLYVSVYNAPELDLGKHRVDLTRFLPLKLEELEEDKSSGKWTTSFKLSGKARGATMNVSFGYVVNDSNSSKNDCEILRTTKMDELNIHRAGSLPSRPSASYQSAEDVKDLHEVLPMPRSELCDSVKILYEKMDEDISSTSVENKAYADSLTSSVGHHEVELLTQPDIGENFFGTKCEMTGFSVIDKGIVELTEENAKPEDALFENEQISKDFVDGLEPGFAVKVAPGEEADSAHPSALEAVPQSYEQSKNSSSYKEQENEMCSKESLMKELEAALISTSDLANEGLDSQEDETDAIAPESYSGVDSNYIDRKKGKSLSFDGVTDSVARDFLEMLGMEHSPLSLSSESEPESPRERLLREFEKDALANGGLLNFDIDDDPAELVSDIPMGSLWGTTFDEVPHSSVFEGYEEMHKIETDEFRTKTMALRMEDLETEALMREWGLNDQAFQHSPPNGSGGFGSPIDISPEDPQPLPPLAEGLGPFLQTKDGGFVRSMNPALFTNAKNGGSLIMQVSSPVVVPAKMGAGVMDILQGLASVGIEKLSMQANKLMPLEDITGKTIQQIAWESASSLDGPERQDVMQNESEILQNLHGGQKSVNGTSPVPNSRKIESGSPSSDAEYVSLEDLAPLAMDKIEALSIEGLRIQSGMSDEDAPSNISAQSIGEFSALKGKTVDVGGSIGLDGTCGLQLMDIKDNGEENVDGLMGLSLTLDEWVKLDSGEIDDDELVSERTSKILAAHHATSLDLFRGRSKGEKRRGKRKYGLLGNNFTVALMVQLRDPLRNYEPVGTPILALIQVERVFVPPKPRIYSTVSMVGNSNEDEEMANGARKDNTIEKPKEEKTQVDELVPQYIITEVHVAGLKMEEGKKKLWGSTNQQQAGSRWLLANGMGKKNKHSLMKSKAVGKSSIPMTTKVQPGDTLWSISSRIHGTEAKWKEIAALNPHIRNPNVILPNETIRLR